MEKPSFKSAVRFWLKLGFISFGGPAGQIGIMHEELVDKKKWISDKKFLHALNYCMLLPGPEAQQLATYIGWLLHGRKGGVIAGLFFILPSVFILTALCIIYVTFGKIPWVYSLFDGLKPAVIAIVILALIRIGKRSLHSWLHYFLAALSFIAIFFFNVDFPLIILSVIILAIILKFISPKIFDSGPSEKKNISEAGYYLTTETVIPHTGFNAKRFGIQFLFFGFLWCLPLALFYFLLPGDFIFWRHLSLFFTQAAFVTIGGAYAVLPYVAPKAVESFNWLSSLQMVDGLALGETTPGPLIMVLAFVGFMAGFSHQDHSIVFATIGLLTTTFYTFLPSFLFIFAGAPMIERTQNNKYVKDLLSLVTAAIVGVVLNLTIYFGEAVLFGVTNYKEINFNHLNYLHLGWIIISFVAMYRYKIGMIPWIGISALFGLLSYFFN